MKKRIWKSETDKNGKEEQKKRTGYKGTSKIVKIEVEKKVQEHVKMFYF